MRTSLKKRRNNLTCFPENEVQNIEQAMRVGHIKMLFKDIHDNC